MVTARSALLPLLLLLAWGSAPALCHAQAPAREVPTPDPVGVEVSAGLTGGWTGPGWVACEVALTHRRATPAAAEVVLRVERDGATRWEARRRVELPARGKRREWFLVPLRPGPISLACAVHPLDAEGQPGPALGQTSRAVSVQAGQRHQRSVLYLSSRPSAPTDSLTLFDPNLGNIPQYLERREPDELPHQPFGLRDLDLIVLHDVDLSRIARDQRETLHDWVRRGGTVLLIPGRRAGWFQSPGIAELAGAKVSAHNVDRLPRLERALGRLNKSGESRVGFTVFSLGEAEGLEGASAGGVSLVERRRYGHTYSFLQRRRLGRGRVLLLATDLTLPPFDRWQKPRAALLQALAQAIEDSLVRRREALPYQRTSPTLRPDLAELLDSNQRPSALLITLMILLYLICVGPLNVGALRKRDAPLLAALTVPGVALVFTLIAILGGYLTKGLGTVVWRVSVVRAELGAPRGVEQTALSLRSSGAGQHEVTFAPGARATRVFHREASADEVSQVLRDEEGMSFSGVRLDTWEQGVFEANGEVGLGKGLRLSRAGEDWRVHNETPYRLTGVAVLDASNTLHFAPAVPPGGEVTTTLGPTSGRRTAGLQVLRALADGDFRDERLGRLALDEYADDLMARPGISVVARLDRSPSQVLVDGDEDADREVALLVLHAEDQQ
ncbi:MAG TPA: hypothetical protein DEA08_11000 [Planctomycetes bacterium]|nr:hypothetical protein [Planctomycetota bacterium]